MGYFIYLNVIFRIFLLPILTKRFLPKPKVTVSDTQWKGLAVFFEHTSKINTETGDMENRIYTLTFRRLANFFSFFQMFH